MLYGHWRKKLEMPMDVGKMLRDVIKIEGTISLWFCHCFNIQVSSKLFPCLNNNFKFKKRRCIRKFNNNRDTKLFFKDVFSNNLDLKVYA
jgi:hypothetical protein